MNNKNELAKYDANILEKIGRDEDKFSLNDLWVIAGSPEDKRPYDWKDLKQTKEFMSSICNVLNTDKNGIIKTKRGKGGGTYGIKHVVLEYAQYLDSRKADFADAALKKIRFSFGDIKSLRSFAVLQIIIYYAQGIFYALEASILKIYREVVSVYHSLWRMIVCSKIGYDFSFFINNK